MNACAKGLTQAALGVSLALVGFAGLDAWRPLAGIIGSAEQAIDSVLASVKAPV